MAKWLLRGSRDQTAGSREKIPHSDLGRGVPNLCNFASSQLCGVAMSSNRHGRYGRSHYGRYNLRKKAPRSFSTLHRLGFSADESPNELLAPVAEEIESEEPDTRLSTEDEEGAVGYASRLDDVALRDQGSDSEPSGADRQPFGPTAGPSGSVRQPPEPLSDSETELATEVGQMEREIRKVRAGLLRQKRDALRHELQALQDSAARAAAVKRQHGNTRGKPKKATRKQSSPRMRKAKAAGSSTGRKKSATKSTKSVTIDHLRSINELSELADGELADLGFGGEHSDSGEPDSDEDPGTEPDSPNVNKNCAFFDKRKQSRWAGQEFANQQGDLLDSFHSGMGEIKMRPQYDLNYDSSVKSGIKDRVSDLVKTKLVYAHMGLPFERSRQGKMTFHDLDYAAFVEGELGVILDTSSHTSEGEMMGRLKLIQKISQMQTVYEWSAVHDFYASILHKIERGAVRWGTLDLPALELSIMSRASLLVNKSGLRGQGKGASFRESSWGGTGSQQPRAAATVERGKRGGAQSVFFCSPFQRNKCWYDGPHPGNYNGRTVTRLHICATCWQKDRKQCPHPESANECPHNKQWRRAEKPSLEWLVWANAKIGHLGQPNYLGAQIPAPSGLNIPFLKSHCSRVEDKLIIKFAEFGCPIGLDKSVKLLNKKVQNHKGAREFPKQIDSYLEKECRLGACIGPFQQNPFKQACHISPINSVEKRDSTERRVIVDLSYPKNGLSVNAAINLDLVSDMDMSLKYPTVDALVDLVVRKVRGCALMKRDLSRAYRQIPVDMGDIHTLGYQWRGGTVFRLSLTHGVEISGLFLPEDDKPNSSYSGGWRLWVRQLPRWLWWSRNLD